MMKWFDISTLKAGIFPLIVIIRSRFKIKTRTGMCVCVCVCVCVCGQTNSFPGFSHKYQVCAYAQSCPILCHPIDCSPPDSSVHGTSQAKILEWVAVSSSRGSLGPRIESASPTLAGAVFTTELPGKPLNTKAVVNCAFR